MSDSILVYSSEATSRLEYIAQLLLTELLGLKVDYTQNQEVYNGHSGAKINYSNESLDGYTIRPDGLLFESGLNSKHITSSEEWNGLPTISIDHAHFDVLAASFYLVSRYEEYTIKQRDDHNRFPASASCLVQLGLIARPIVNEWALALADQLRATYSSLTIKPRSFEYLSTIDIDQAWKYKNKGFRRNWGGFIGDVLNWDKAKLKERINVQLKGEEDPFYNFTWQDDVHRRFNTQVRYFIQVGQRGQFDKNVSLSNTTFQRLIKHLHKEHGTGIHPSYQSNKETTLVKTEKEGLESVLNEEVTVSRQHFLMLEMPKTYQHLASLGIKEEHSLGYSTHAGFRAGIAAPFRFYDLTQEQTVDLTLVPFCLMDITPLHYDKLSVDETKEFITSMLENVARVGGLFVSLWHNESLSESERWQGWRTVYHHLIAESNRIK